MNGKVKYKDILAKIFGITSDSPTVEAYLNDPEIGKDIRNLLDEIQTLRKRIISVTKEIKILCRLRPEDWDSVIENAIIAETGKDTAAADRTRNRKKEILDVINTAIDEGMGPSDIRTIIEVMVMGMQPGEAQYLPSEPEKKEVKPPAPKPVKNPIESVDQNFLKTKF